MFSLDFFIFKQIKYLSDSFRRQFYQTKHPHFKNLRTLYKQESENDIC